MSPRLPRVTARELLSALKRDGWYVARTGGSSHTQPKHSTKPGRVTVAMHVGDILVPKTLTTILEQAGLTADELRELL